MFNKIKQYFNRKNLKDEKLAYLFEAPIEGEYVCFDCETTGLNPKVDEIISIGAVIIKDNKILASKKFQRFIKTKNKKLTSESIKIHRIRECDLENANEDFYEVLDEFLEFVGSRRLVGYYLEFDVAMINKYLKPKYGITIPNEQIEVSAVYYDKKIALIPQGNIDLRFDTIMKDLQLPLLSKHDAINDAIMTALMFVKLQNTTKLS